MMVYVLSNTLAIFEIQFIIKLSNTKPELKQGVAYTNVSILQYRFHAYCALAATLFLGCMQ